MDHLRIIFALESKLKTKHIPNEFEEAIQNFEEKKNKINLKVIGLKNKKLKDVAKKVIRRLSKSA